MTEDERFWAWADALVSESEIVIDRPARSHHPRHPDIVYPLDYGYLAATRAMDGGGIDAWRGSLPEPRVTAAIATVDRLKRDAEVKLLLGCTRAEAGVALAVHRNEYQAAILIWREARVSPGD